MSTIPLQDNTVQEKVRYDSKYVSKLLTNALEYFAVGQSKDSTVPLPQQFASVRSAITHFKNALVFEAGQSFLQPTTVKIPKDSADACQQLMLRSVNLESSSPGLITQLNGEKVTIQKVDIMYNSQLQPNDSTSNDSVPNDSTSNDSTSNDSTSNDAKIDNMTDKAYSKLIEKHKASIEKERAKLEQRAAKSAAKSAERKAQSNRKKELKSEQRSIKKSLSKNPDMSEREQLEDSMNEITQELEQMGAKPKDTTKNKGQIKDKDTSCNKSCNKSCDNSDGASDNNPKQGIDANNTESAEEQLDELEKTLESQDTDKDMDKDTDKDTDKDMDKDTANSQSMIRKEELYDTVVSTNDISNMAIYESPIPHTRHLDALMRCEPNPLIARALLGKVTKNLYTDCVKLYHGPPGTGKTWTLMRDLKEILESSIGERVYVCAGSNVGVLNMYNRAVQDSIPCSLNIRKDRLPNNTFIATPKKRYSKIARERVVFGTISSRFSGDLRDRRFHTIILDEAAQVQEAWVWGLLRPEVHRLIMAGDPQQLPAVVSQAGVSANHGRSIMERLISTGYPCELLGVQRRMHPDIVAFPNKEFYKGKLETNYTEKPLKELIASNNVNRNNVNINRMSIVNTNTPEARIGTSYANQGEVDKIFELYNELKPKQDVKVVVISPYQAQCNLLLRKFANFPDVEIHTVDSFQGQEADIVFLTTVRNGSQLGFWTDSRRLCVALTRARHLLYVIGNIDTWKTSQEAALARLA